MNNFTDEIMKDLQKMDFMECYWILNFPYRLIVRGLLEDFNRDGKELKIEPSFSTNFEINRKKLNLTYEDVEKKINENTNLEGDIKNTLWRSMKRKSKNSSYSKEVAEALEISETELLYGLKDELDVLALANSVPGLYDALDKKTKNIMLNLIRRLCALQFTPELFEDSEQDWDDPQKILDFLEIENEEDEESEDREYVKRALKYSAFNAASNFWNPLPDLKPQPEDDSEDNPKDDSKQKE